MTPDEVRSLLLIVKSYAGADAGREAEKRIVVEFERLTKLSEDYKGVAEDAIKRAQGYKRELESVRNPSKAVGDGSSS